MKKTVAMTDRTSLEKVDRILKREDYESLEQRVAAQHEALKEMHRALREMAREIDRRLAKIDPPNPMARY